MAKSKQSHNRSAFTTNHRAIQRASNSCITFRLRSIVPSSDQTFTAQSARINAKQKSSYLLRNKRHGQPHNVRRPARTRTRQSTLVKPITSLPARNARNKGRITNAKNLKTLRPPKTARKTPQKPKGKSEPDGALRKTPTPTSKRQLARDQNAGTIHAITIMPMHHPPHARNKIYAPTSISQMQRLVRLENPKFPIDPLLLISVSAAKNAGPARLPTVSIVTDIP
jgi:hypothetical protein